MKHLLPLLALLPSLSWAIPAPPLAVEMMVAQSEFYMNCDICQVANNRITAVGGFAQYYVPGKGLIRIPAEQYNVVASAGKQVGLSGLFLMSEVVQQSCRDDWGGGVCFAARFLWKQAWPTNPDGSPLQCITPSGATYTARQQ